MATLTRSSDPRLQILKESPGEEHLKITGSKLPTYNQVLLCYLSKLNELRSQDVAKTAKLSFDAAKYVVSQIVPHYLKAHIPIILEKSIAHKIILFHDKDYKECVKIPSARRMNNSKIASFREKLYKTMPFYPTDAETIMNENRKGKTETERKMIEDDILFLRNMMTTRTFSYVGQDNVCAQIEAKRINRSARESLRLEKEEERKVQSSSKEDINYDIHVYDDEHTDLSYDQPSTPKQRKHRRVVKTGTPGFWPHNVLKNPLVVETAVRNNITPAAMAELTTSLIKATSGDEKKVTLSYNRAYTYRIETVNSIAERINASWKPPLVAAIHWDGKLMDSLGNEYAQEERLPILVSGIGGIKLLGVPALQHKTDSLLGPKIAKATLEQLEIWNCKENVKAMVFDTTASNTGALTAACVSIQDSLNRELLWLACRHHIGEILLVHSWDALKIEVSKSPEISLFLRFKDNFEKLSYQDLANIYIPDCPETLAEQRTTIISLCQDALKTGFSRGDYKELIELTLVYLNSAPDSFKRIQRPGALHKARWMAKLIYSIKIILLSKQIQELPPGTILGTGQLQKLEEYVQFVIYCYVSWWIVAPVASTSPMNDLNLIHTLLNYRNINLEAPAAALKAIGNHMWYLTEELTPLSLYSDYVDDTVKSEVAEKILETECAALCLKRKGSGHGKPVFPIVPKEPTCKLADFVGSDSWAFFRILGINTEFLYLPVCEWPLNESYRQGKNIVAKLCVVNDAAERGVKLCSDFLHTSKKETTLQNTLQVVENCRSRRPNQRKRKLQSERWWLKLD